MDLEERYKAYILLERGLAKNTREAYCRDVGRYMAYLADEGLSPRDVRLDDLHRFAWLLHDVGISPRSVARILSGVRSFHAFLVLEGYTETDPTELLQSPKVGRHLPEVLSVEEIDRLEAAIDLSQREGQRDLAIIETLYGSGLRVSELCALTLADLYMDEGFLRVTGKGSKQRLVPLSPRAAECLRLWFADRAQIDLAEEEADYVFVSARRRRRLSRITVFHLVRVYAARAGITKAVGPHTFRHSFATHLLEGGANLRAIQAMLGHESITTTEVYTHLDRRFLRQQIIDHFPRNRRYAAPRGATTAPMPEHGAGK